MKIDYANEVCLGGVMVWAVDQDDSVATMTNQLAQALGLPANSKSVSASNTKADNSDPGLVALS